MLMLLLINLPLTSSTNCPSGCQCDESTNTATCTSATGLQSIDKSVPFQRLILSGLELTKVPAQLENIRNITDLDLSNNQLAEVNHLGKRIRHLNLSRNRITSAKLGKIPLFVESLNLTHNEITYLPPHLMKLRNLRHIELANNPINCTCETLHIRNWLTTRHVWTDQHVKCSAPVEFKGRPWLQVKQADVCHRPPSGAHNWDDYDEDENELMLGDEPRVDDAEEEDGDDLTKEFMPVDKEHPKKEPPMDIQNSDDEIDGSGDGSSPGIGADEVDSARELTNQVSGSGEESNETLTAVQFGQIQHSTDKYDEEEDGSGSGIGLPIDLIVPHNDFETENLGIFQGNEESSTVLSTTEDSDFIAPIRVPVEVSSETSTDESTDLLTEGKVQEPVVRADSDSQGTYILLAVLAIVLVSLIILVICRRKPDARNRRGKNDLEAARGRELLDMDKSLLGKPLEKNGHNPPERTPLMNDKSDADKVFADKPNNYAPAKPERTSLERPVMESFKPVPADRNKSKESLYENVPSNNNNNTVPLSNGNGPVRNGDPAGIHQPNHNVPSSQVDGEYPPANGAPNQLQPDSNGVDSPKAKRYSPIYVPTSPKSDRYSPVYSPETGRVKIKLTETPKPKTPILVTRSRSRAGDYITTPDQKF